MHARLGVLLTLALAAFPAAASAADFNGELSANTPKFAWEGSGTGLPTSTADDPTLPIRPFACGGTAHECQYAALKIVDPGDVTLTATVDGGQSASDPSGTFGALASYPDIDVSLYKAAADGSPEGDSLTGTDCAGSATPETCVAKGVAPGSYVVEVSFFLANGAAYKADAALATTVPPTPAAPAPSAPAAQPAPAEPAPAPQAAPAPAPAAQPAPAAKPVSTKKKSSAKATCTKKAKKVKNAKKRKRALKACAKKK
jgi:hypothetical protein